MEELISQLDDDTYSPKSIAWKLLLDDKLDCLTSQILAFSEDRNSEDDGVSFFFEILLQIFMEMLYDLILINNLEDENVDKIIYDLNKINLNQFIEIMIHKFKIIHILLRIETFEEDHDINDQILKNRYCRIALKCNQSDIGYFLSNKNDLQYTFILNGSFQKKDQIDDLFSIVTLNNKFYKISFSHIKSINQITDVLDNVPKFFSKQIE